LTWSWTWHPDYITGQGKVISATRAIVRGRRGMEERWGAWGFSGTLRHKVKKCPGKEKTLSRIPKEKNLRKISEIKRNRNTIFRKISQRGKTRGARIHQSVELGSWPLMERNGKVCNLTRRSRLEQTLRRGKTYKTWDTSRN